MNNKRFVIKNSFTYVTLILLSAVVLLPFYWMITTSMKEPANIFLFPPQWIPNPIRWRNFAEIFEKIPFGTQFFNSVYISFLVTAGTCLFGALAGYAFAKMKFKFKNVIFLFLLSSIMIPTEATVIPLFQWMSKLHFINTHLPLIIPPMLGAGGMFGVFMLRQFFLTVPDSLLESARIDGCGHFKTFLLVFPLAAGVVSSLFIYTFLNVWNEFLNPLIFLNSAKLYTIPLALSLLTDQGGTDWHLIMVGAVLATMPLLIIFFLAQKQFIEGIAMTGVKG